MPLWIQIQHHNIVQNCVYPETEANGITLIGGMQDNCDHGNRHTGDVILGSILLAQIATDAQGNELRT